jgi:hypothetical protein
VFMPKHAKFVSHKAIEPCVADDPDGLQVRDV